MKEAEIVFNAKGLDKEKKILFNVKTIDKEKEILSQVVHHYLFPLFSCHLTLFGR